MTRGLHSTCMQSWGWARCCCRSGAWGAMGPAGIGSGLWRGKCCLGSTAVSAGSSRAGGMLVQVGGCAALSLVQLPGC